MTRRLILAGLVGWLLAAGCSPEVRSRRAVNRVLNRSPADPPATAPLWPVKASQGEDRGDFFMRRWNGGPAP